MNNADTPSTPADLDAAVEELRLLLNTEHWYCTLPDYFRQSDPLGASSVAFEHAKNKRRAPYLTGDRRGEYLENVCRLLLTFDPIVVEAYYSRRAAG